MYGLYKRTKLMELAVLPFNKWSNWEVELANKYIVEEAKWEQTSRSKFIREPHLDDY